MKDIAGTILELEKDKSPYEISLFNLRIKMNALKQDGKDIDKEIEEEKKMLFYISQFDSEIERHKTTDGSYGP
ncbi:MAG: hypothetical protein NTY88_15230 [Bacteroidetes bacterium]|nr:hypothetical protein [Bacteroidota bacterium]